MPKDQEYAETVHVLQLGDQLVPANAGDFIYYHLGHNPGMELIEVALTFHDNDNPGGTYLRLNGTDSMEGDLNMGGNDVTNVGNVDGVDVSAHAARHIKDGADEIDGDQLDIDWDPDNYVPSTTPSPVSDVDHLGAHLAGIDALLGDHDARHETGGADEMDLTDLWGQTVFIDFFRLSTATNVTELYAEHNRRTTQPGTGPEVSVPRAVVLTHCTVVAFHDDTTPPGTWVARIRKNGSGSDSATFTFNWSASVNTDRVTQGALSSNVTISTSDRFHILLNGTGIDRPQIRVMLHARTTSS